MHASRSVGSIARLVNTPEPAGTTLPSNANPSTVEPPADTWKPLASAAPPEPPVTFAPDILNWNPPILSGLSYKTSKLVVVAAPRVIEAVKHQVPSPLQIPHGS